jgi:carbonic anhydrase/acetyltransferase-like protein (isoleucine patch superfamily)
MIKKTMALVKTIQGKTPKIGKDSWLAETATVIGEVQMGSQCTIWYNAVLRGDVNFIKLGDKVNVQDNAMVHCTYKKAGTSIGNEVTIGHNAIVHGCIIEDKVLIGMGSIVMDNAHIGQGAIVAAGAVVLENEKIPPHTLWAGVPARQVKELDASESEKAIEHLANNYVMYASWYKD